MLLSRVFVSGSYIGVVEVHVVSEAIDGMMGFFRIAPAPNGAYDLYLDSRAAESPGGQHVLAKTTRKAAPR